MKSWIDTVRLKTEAVHKCCNLVGNLFYVYMKIENIISLCEKKERPKRTLWCCNEIRGVSMNSLWIDRQTDRHKYILTHTHTHTHTHTQTCICMSESVVVVQLLSCVWLFLTPWTATRQASLGQYMCINLLAPVLKCPEAMTLRYWADVQDRNFPGAPALLLKMWMEAECGVSTRDVHVRHKGWMLLPN